VTGRPPITLIAAELGLGRAPAARLAATGLIDTLADLRTLAARAQLAPQPDTLVVSLGPLVVLDDEQARDDGCWRSYRGWARHLPADDVARSAGGWWRASRIPRTLVAVTTGGFTVGAWEVTGIDDITDGGFYRFALGSPRPDLVGYRVPVTRGPTARWLDEPAPGHAQSLNAAMQD
jgi:hypothetical protein